MDKEKLLKDIEEKKRELEELEKAIKALEKPSCEEPFDNSDLLKEIKGFPRYYINRQGEIFHESGLVIKKTDEKTIELFDPVNNKVLVKIEDLLKENF